jgi:hypothetical protein
MYPHTLAASSFRAWPLIPVVAGPGGRKLLDTAPELVLKPDYCSEVVRAQT